MRDTTGNHAIKNANSAEYNPLCWRFNVTDDKQKKIFKVTLSYYIKNVLAERINPTKRVYVFTYDTIAGLIPEEAGCSFGLVNIMRRAGEEQQIARDSINRGVLEHSRGLRGDKRKEVALEYFENDKQVEKELRYMAKLQTLTSSNAKSFREWHNKFNREED